MPGARSRVVRILAAAAVALLPLAGCAVTEEAEPSAAPDSTTIAFLLPESKTSRYEGIDRPVF